MQDRKNIILGNKKEENNQIRRLKWIRFRN